MAVKSTNTPGHAETVTVPMEGGGTATLYVGADGAPRLDPAEGATIIAATRPEVQTAVAGATASVSPALAAANAEHAAIRLQNQVLTAQVEALTARVTAIEGGEVVDDAATANLQAAVAVLTGKIDTLTVTTAQLDALIKSKRVQGSTGESTIASLASGTPVERTITLSAPMGTAPYPVFVTTDGGTQVLGNPPAVVVVSQTAQQVKVRVTNNAVLSLSGVTVRVLALELA